MTAVFDMMHLKFGPASARLASPTISLENSGLKLAIALWIKLYASSSDIHFEPSLGLG
jgi:hypothetical protein